VAIAAGAFEPFYLRIFTTNRAWQATMLTELPYRKLPGLRQFLLDVRERTPRGSVIAVAAPLTRTHDWEGGYDYIYARALYPLAGRRVVPVLDPDNRFLAQNLAEANYVAAYHSAPRVDGFVEVWRGRDGVLLRRAR
jgi:hypothetical protein